MKKPEIHPATFYDPRDDMISELSATINSLVHENTLLKDKISIGQWNATEIEKIDITQILAELRRSNDLLEKDNWAIRKSRDWFQNQAGEVIRSRNYWEKLAKKLQKLLGQGGQNA
jgi:coproporphyrinogen III oxidase-like Fe-S oxidoreductase